MSIIRRLAVDKYPAVRNLFDSNYPNLPIVYAIIAKNIEGNIWVDNEDPPSVCLITCSAPYCFIAGKLTKATWVEFLSILKEKGLVKLVCPPATNTESILFTAFGFAPVTRLQYQYKNPMSVPQHENTSKFELRPIRQDNFSLCNWQTLLTSMYGDENKYHAHGIGVALWDPEAKRIVSEAHGVVSDDMIEIGTVTHEEYRGKKLSTIVCNYLIRESINEGLRPIWTCDEANIASQKVAEHQGMDDKFAYIFHTLK